VLWDPIYTRCRPYVRRFSARTPDGTLALTLKLHVQSSLPVGSGWSFLTWLIFGMAVGLPVAMFMATRDEMESGP